MESVFDLVISGIMLALPVLIFFAGFFIIFGELFRTVNAIYTLRFSDAFVSFVINNEGYPLVNPSGNWTPLELATVKGGLAYVSYTPVVNKRLNIVIYPEPHVYSGVISGEKLDLFTRLATEYGNSYLRMRFSMGDGYDLFISSPKTGKAWGVLLPGLESNYLSSVDFIVKFPVKVLSTSDVDTSELGDVPSAKKTPEIDVLSFSYKDFSSSGLLTSLNSKNDITPPSGFINAPVLYGNGTTVFRPMWFTILVNEKVYRSLAENYFYERPRVEVYVEALYGSSIDTMYPEDPVAVELVVSLSRFIPDYKKINSAKLVITYRYGAFKLTTAEYYVKPDDEFFIIPIDWTKSVAPDELKEYEKYNDKITLEATVSYILTYNGKEYTYTAPVTIQIPLTKGS